MLEFAIFSFFSLPFATADDYVYVPCSLCIGEASPEVVANSVTLRLYDGSTEQYTEEPADDPLPFIDRMDLTRLTVLIISGWTGDLFINRVPTVALLDAFLERQDCNVLELKWNPIAFNEYTYAARSTEAVGHFAATGLNRLVAAGLIPALLHVIGHSLGAHIAGFIGQNVDFEMRRITGLDPAGPLFGDSPLLRYLRDGDALFVIIIHSNAGLLGIGRQTGSVDFHPNGGGPIQPGCEISLQAGCSHFRSDYFMAESARNETAFVGRRCDSEAQFDAGSCETNPTVVMGFATPTTARGRFYLVTNRRSPFGRGQAGASPLD